MIFLRGFVEQIIIISMMKHHESNLLTSLAHNKLIKNNYMDLPDISHIPFYPLAVLTGTRFLIYGQVGITIILVEHEIHRSGFRSKVLNYNTLGAAKSQGCH